MTPNFLDWKRLLEQDISIRFIQERKYMIAYAYFLYQYFKEDTSNTCYSRNDLIEKLVFFLQEEDIIKEEDNAEIDYRQSAKKWVDHWSHRDVGYLEEFKDNKGNTQLKASLYLMRVFQWIDSLKQKDFIGTESRLQDIFSKLDKIIASSQPKTAEEQIKDLWGKIDDLMKQIDDLKKNQNIYLGLDERQLNEEYNLLLEMMSGLSFDFRAVEQKFKEVAKGIQQEQLKKENTKGKTLRYYLDADDEIKNSAQGKSFYGFWRLVNNTQKRAHFDTRVAELFLLLETFNITYDKRELKTFFRKLSVEGREIEEVNNELIGKIRRIISEQATSDRKALRTAINEIKASLSNKPIQDANDFFLEVDAFKVEDFPKWYTLAEAPNEKKVKRTIPTNKNSGVFDMMTLFDPSLVDIEKMKKNITALFQKHTAFSIETLSREYPFSSVQDALVYMHLALNPDKNSIWTAWIKTNEIVFIPYNTSENLQLKMPNIYFSLK